MLFIIIIIIIFIIIIIIIIIIITIIIIIIIWRQSDWWAYAWKVYTPIKNNAYNTVVNFIVHIWKII